AGYALGRFWIEGLRTDQLLLPGIGLPVSQVLSAVIVVVVAIFVIYKRMKQKKTGEAVSQTK
ncbi:MAG: prolipoprotein diacylglyceryl transferase family protein, partial [Catenibacillus sp.]|nr:prolipoprotein diacylglyceryl transferase family protein [Catenibacillus sp.]